MNIQIWTKNPVQDAILVLAKITIFLSVFCFVFEFLFLAVVFLQGFVSLNCLCLVIKIVKLVFFAIKHRDNLRRRKQDGSRVNTFLLSGFMSSFCLVIFLE